MALTRSKIPIFWTLEHTAFWRPSSTPSQKRRAQRRRSEGLTDSGTISTWTMNNFEDITGRHRITLDMELQTRQQTTDKLSLLHWPGWLLRHMQSVKRLSSVTMNGYRSSMYCCILLDHDGKRVRTDFLMLMIPQRTRSYLHRSEFPIHEVHKCRSYRTMLGGELLISKRGDPRLCPSWTYRLHRSYEYISGPARFSAKTLSLSSVDVVVIPGLRCKRLAWKQRLDVILRRPKGA